MAWLEAILDELAAAKEWSYRPGGTAATEPTALAALALAAHGRNEPAERARRWLASVQSTDGSLGINAKEPAPHWPTGMAVLAWQSAAEVQATTPYDVPIQRALKWILTIEGEATQQNPDLGHDTTLVGWPWVEGTHSWIEPTAWYLLALQVVGRRAQPRAREAVALLINRQLPDGGCNYGNTTVLGQTLRAQLEPTGLTLLALAGEKDNSGRLQKSMEYVLRSVGAETTAASLAYGLMGLAAHGQLPTQADGWLAAAAERTRQRPGAQPRLALLALAASGAVNPIVMMCKQKATP